MSEPTVIADADEMREHGRQCGLVTRAGAVVVLTGPLGAGKTTWVQGFADGLGVRGPITSPTFVVARIHPSVVGGPDLVHVDAYRVGSELEFDDLGLDERLTNSVVVIEWGADTAAALVSSWTEVVIERHAANEHDGAEGTRTVWVNVIGPESAGD